jgi:hypothetical protein
VESSNRERALVCLVLRLVVLAAGLGALVALVSDFGWM